MSFNITHIMQRSFNAFHTHNGSVGNGQYLLRTSPRLLKVRGLRQSNTEAITNVNFQSPPDTRTFITNSYYSSSTHKKSSTFNDLSECKTSSMWEDSLNVRRKNAFQEFVNRIGSEEQRKKFNIRRKSRDEHCSLKGMLRKARKYSKQEDNAIKVKKAKVNEHSENITPTRPSKLALPESYRKSICKPSPLISSERYLQRVQLHRSFVQKTKDILSESDQELFDRFESARITLLKNNEWFINTEAQKEVYLIFTDIEQQWLQPYFDKEQKTLNEKRTILEEELKQKLNDENLL